MQDFGHGRHTITASESCTRFIRMAITLLALVSAFSTVACATRTVNQRVINRYGLDVYLRSEKKIMGQVVDRGFDQPSDITVGRLRRILGSLEIERHEGARTVRGPAFRAELLAPISSGLAEAFREAEPSQEIVVMATRKQMQKGIFNRKFLTSFVSFIEAGDLVVHLSRVDWPIDENNRNRRRDRLPMPRVDEPQQRFRVVANEYVKPTGITGVRVNWNDAVFSEFAGRTTGTMSVSPEPSQAPVAKTKTILMEAEPAELPAAEPLTQGQIEQLSPSVLRELADLEEARRAGQITEVDYRKRHTEIIDGAGAN